MVDVTLVVTAVVYVLAASLATRRGRRHRLSSTVAFVAGLAVLAVALRDQWGSFTDETPWVHDTQHALIMSVAPPLLALGAPVTLLLQVLRTPAARRLVTLLHTPVLRATCGPAAAVHVPLEYYGVMAAYVLTPAYALSLDNTAFHLATHLVFFVCGLLFWVPVVGLDATGWRPGRRARLALVGVGLPVNALLALALGSMAFLVANEAATAFGLLLVASRVYGGARRRPVRLAAPVIARTEPAHS